MFRHFQPQLTHALRVSAVVALLMAVLYSAVAWPVAVSYNSRLLKQVDARVADRLGDIVYGGSKHVTTQGRIPPDKDLRDAPVLVWQVGPVGLPVALTAGAPALPAGPWERSPTPATVALAGQDFRVRAAKAGSGWVVAGENLAQAQHVESLVQTVEIAVGPVFVVAMFLGSLAIGFLASRPVELARRRQLDFTADASHELRTPLTVIEAEVGLALSARRDAAGYRHCLGLIGNESQRLRHIVEDLLFLARFDSAPPAPAAELVDVATLAEACAQRFETVARGRNIEISVQRGDENDALIKAAPGWVDRLFGVLVDNACRFAGAGGQVRVGVSTKGNAVKVAVEDSGPGIEPDEVPFLFDRFHRATAEGEGAGLGLAIADAVVRSSGGKWRVGRSALGGARMEVAWRRQVPRNYSIRPIPRAAERVTAGRQLVPGRQPADKASS